MPSRATFYGLAWIGILALARGQAGPQAISFRSPVHVLATVVDQAGNPISEVHVDHISLRAAFVPTDSRGHAEFDAEGPAVAFRKAGWKSQLIALTRESNQVHVELERANEPMQLPVCSKRPHCVTTGGIFCLPKTRGVSVGDIPYTIDTLERAFTIASLFGRWRTMTHGTGTAWGGPQPRTREVWDSIELQETQYEARGLLVIDARGKTSDGQLWRSIGRDGESVYYHGQDEKDALLFDRMLDGLCAIPAK